MLRKVLGFLAIPAFVFSAFVFAFAQATDQITITTYYPSPYGSYSTLRLVPKPNPGACQPGEIFYDNGASPGLYYCDNTSAWQPLSGFWASVVGSTNDIHNTNPGNVGIGTGAIAPASLLTVSSANPGTAITRKATAISLSNTSNVVNSDALQWIGVAGDLAGNPYTVYDIAGVRGWSVGVDNSDANKFKIDATSAGPGAGGGANTVLALTAGRNVGIGTANPTQRLHVQGVVRIVDGSQAANKVFTSDANGNGTWQYKSVMTMNYTSDLSRIKDCDWVRCPANTFLLNWFVTDSSNNPTTVIDMDKDGLKILVGGFCDPGSDWYKIKLFCLQ